MTHAAGPPRSDDDTAPLPPIVRPYLLVLFSVPFHVDADGRRWLEPLWAKDLVEHTAYLHELTLAARVVPEAWFLAPIARLRHRPLYINVESAFWRLVPGEPASFARLARAAVVERLNRACVGRADLATFTHDGYRRTLLGAGEARGHVVEASWIDDANLLDAAAVEPTLRARLARAARETGGASGVRLVFAGRLNAAKGVPQLLDAVAQARAAGVAVSLDLYGAGPLEAECAARAREPALAGAVRLCGTLAYGPLFFEALRSYDALVVAPLSDEQPRIVYDAYAQAVPVIASRTAGLLQCVEDGVTGLTVPTGDVGALAAAIERLARDPALRAALGRAGLARARGLTHRNMHRRRWRLLLDAFPQLARPPA